MTVEENPATLEPQEFARLIKRSSANELQQLMAGGQRRAVLDEIFARMPAVFRADKAGPTEGIVHWRIGGRPDGGQDVYELVIGNGSCGVSATPRHTPRLALTISAVDFVKVVTGNANPMTLFLRGRMKAKGDLGLATQFPGLFEVPATDRCTRWTCSRCCPGTGPTVRVHTRTGPADPCPMWTRGWPVPVPAVRDARGTLPDAGDTASTPLPGSTMVS